jgi:large subunit ribosomal protein L10
MKDRKTKQNDLDHLRQELLKAPHVFVTTFDKLTVAQDFELRKTVRNAGGTYQVLKNTLAEKASEGLPTESVLKGLKGVSSLAYTTGDPVALAKALQAYAKANPTFTFKSGVVEGRAINLAQVEALANMPPKEAIYAKLLYLINAPAQRIATVINAVGRNVAVVIDQGVQNNKFAA